MPCSGAAAPPCKVGVNAAHLRGQEPSCLSTAKGVALVSAVVVALGVSNAVGGVVGRHAAVTGDGNPSGECYYRSCLSHHWTRQRGTTTGVRMTEPDTGPRQLVLGELSAAHRGDTIAFDQGNGDQLIGRISEVRHYADEQRAMTQVLVA